MPKQQKNKSELLQNPKGMKDILPDHVDVWEYIETTAKEISEYYGFRQIRVPHFEKTELFTRTVGESTDVVEKQMYTFGRGPNSLTLRPEGTAPVMRAYIQHGMHTWAQPVLLYYLGSFFRHEQPQRGRSREFGQFGLEIIGTSNAVSDALIIRVITLILEEIGIKNFIVHLNTLGDKECRGEFRKELVGYYRRKVNYLCKDCKRRLKTNPLRLLDCKEEKCVELQQEAPQIIEYVCDSCRDHFREVIEFLDKVGISYFLDSRLVRGLDYYSRTVFEIFTDPGGASHLSSDVKGAEEGMARPLALASGGRYDYLAETFGLKESKIEIKDEVDEEKEEEQMKEGKEIEQKHSALRGGVGGALGLDRIAELVIGMRQTVKKDTPKAFLIQLGPQAKQQSFILLEEFRKAHLHVASSLSKDSIKNQLRYAARLQVPYALILGQKEAIDKTVIVRDMSTGMQETVAQSKILDYLKKARKNK